MIMVSVPGRHKLRTICLLLSLLLALAPLGLAQTAQSHSGSTGSDDKDKGTSTTSKTTDNTTDKTKSDKPAPTPEELQQMIMEQAKMMETMKAQLKQQQDEIEALKAKAVKTDAVAVGLGAVPATNAVSTTPGAVNTSADPAANNSSAVQAPVNEDAIKNVLGAFRFSGDFRLRFDAIERSSLRNPTTGAIIVGAAHNARARYRLRFNADAIINDDLSFHTQLATGPVNNGLTNDQDFAGVTDRAPFFINEAWVDYHPKAATWFHGQAGRVTEVFADNSRFLFDDDVKFNGFNEWVTWRLKDKPAGFTSIEFRAGQYIFTNPNTAEVSSDPTNAFRVIGLQQGEQIRDAMLFHQGVLFNQSFGGDNWTQQFGGDIQAFRLPNEIQLSSNLANGAPILVFNALGLVLTAGTSGTGNATDSTTFKYFAPRFDVARITYQLNRKAVDSAGKWPLSFNVQMARNVGADVPQKDAILASFAIGQAVKRGDVRFLYIFSIKGANSIISQLTDDDLGTNSGVNIRTHAFRVDISLMKNVVWQNIFFVQRELANNGNVPGFFVPLQGITPRQYRLQTQLQFNFDFNRYTKPSSK